MGMNDLKKIKMTDCIWRKDPNLTPIMPRYRRPTLKEGLKDILSGHLPKKRKVHEGLTPTRPFDDALSILWKQAVFNRNYFKAYGKVWDRVLFDEKLLLAGGREKAMKLRSLRKGVNRE